MSVVTAYFVNLGAKRTQFWIGLAFALFIAGRAFRREGMRSAVARESEWFTRTLSPRHILCALFSAIQLVCLFLSLNGVAGANVCTPLSTAAYGPYPAIVNGIDQVDWGVARIQWTSDATPTTPATQQRIQWATAAQWAAAGSSWGAFQTPIAQVQGLNPFYVTNSSVNQGSVLPNLPPATTIHVIGQSYQGGAWCSATDETFTTPAKPAGTVLPVQPQTFDTTVPTITGTDYTYGVTCGTSGNVTQRLQNCINTAIPAAGSTLNNGIGLPPGTYNYSGVYMPTNPNAVLVTVSGNTFTQSGTAPANGTPIRFGQYNDQIPSPLNVGVTYQVINSSGSTFQASFDGVTAITLNNTGVGNVYYAVWPLNQGWLIFHSTASPSVLPPLGTTALTSVRLGNNSINEYLAQMPNLQLNQYNVPWIVFGELASYVWFQNIEFSTDPAVAQTAACSNCVDPPSFTNPWKTQAMNDHIVLNQCAIAPGAPPQRSQFMQADGSNIGIFNSYVVGFDFWQEFRNIPPATVTTTSVTYPAGFYSWVGQSGTKSQCTYSGGSLTISGTGSGTGYAWVDPVSCNLVVQLPTGISGTGSNISVSSVTTPALPTYTYTSPSGATYTGSNSLSMSIIPISSGAINTASCGIGGYCDLSGGSSQDVESGLGIEFGAGPGPSMVVNNYIAGAGIVGPFWADVANEPCYGVACVEVYDPGNYTERRNTVTTLPAYDYDSPLWNGGNYFWRNGPEVKHAKYVLQDGNVYGPFFPQIGPGECVIHENFIQNFPAGGMVNNADSSEWTFTNNTCFQTATAFSGGYWYYPYNFAKPIKNFYVHNNLFNQVYGYQQARANSPWQSTGYGRTRTSPACSPGRLFEWGEFAQNIIADHNTVFESGGCEDWMWGQYSSLSSGMTFTNNILALSSDNGGIYGGASAYGSFYQSIQVLGGGADTPSCSAFYGTALMNCMQSFTWQNNVIVPFWTNAFPGSLVEFGTSDIANVTPAYPTAGNYWATASTLAGRLSQISWFNPSVSNFRLSYASPYISGGATPAGDGRDIGVDMDALEASQGKVSNVHTFGTTTTGTTIGFLAPDSFGCSVDWGTTNFATGSGSFTRVANSGGQRVQNVTLSGLPTDALIYYRVNCAVQQPLGAVQLP